MSVSVQIENLIKGSFEYSHFELINESHMHSVPPNSETHFKLTLVSKDFEEKSKVARHQMIYKLVSELMQQGLHALALHTYTGDEWALANQISPESPNCHGGSK